LADKPSHHVVCAQCPWRLSNQGKPHQNGFYTKKNLKRLWNQIRGGGGAQSCHLTDPRHPDHIAAGCPKNAAVQECPGSVILIMRELERMADKKGVVSDASLERYLKTRRLGLKRLGILYWVVQRIQLAGVPIVGGAKLPDVDVADREIGLPQFLKG